MLFRGASDAPARPRRAKSALLERPSPLLRGHSSSTVPETARQQALTAAELAFERAKNRDMAKNGFSHAVGTQDSSNEEDSHRLGRRQSVRFTGPSAVPTRACTITRREAPDYKTGVFLRQNILPSHSRHPQHLLPLDGSPITALPQQGHEFIESDIASVPSSYRKLRKAKSMFSPGKSPSAVFSTGTPRSRGHFQRHSMQSSDSNREPLRMPDPRLRRSLSFLRGVTDHLPTSSRQYETQDAAVQLARDQYLRQLEQQRLKEQPSFLNLGKRRRSQKAFRRTVRSSSTNSYGSAIQSPLHPADPAKVRGIGQKARSLSQTLRKTIRRVFRRSSDDEDTVPAQHLPASRPHYGANGANLNSDENHYPVIPSPDVELLRRVGSRESVLRNSAVFVDKESRAGSLRSIPSEDSLSNGQSRVTSWTNSTAANTINIPQMVERKRLSIIKEDGGPHQPSSSARRYAEQTDGYAVFRQPVRQNSGTGRLEPQRVFSALQKEIGKRSVGVGPDDSDSSTDSSSDQSNPQRSHLTLRRASSNHLTTNGAVSTSAQPHRMQVSKSVIFNPVTNGVNESLYQNIHEDYNDSRNQQSFVASNDYLTPQQIAELNEPSLPSPKRPLREVRSAFFPPDMRFERSNTSPYRRAVHKSSEAEPNAKAEAKLTHDYQYIGSPQSMSSRLGNGSVARSDSVYSRTSGGHTPKAIGSSLSLTRSENSGEAGTAVIITRGSERYGRGPLSNFQQRQTSSKSSGEWKNWMASEVSYFEDHGPEHEHIYNDLQVSKGGHKRENAQLDGDGDTIGRLRRPNDSVKQPLGILQANTNSRPVLKHKISHPSVEKSPSLDQSQPPKSNTIRQNETALSKQPSGQSRKKSNDENEKLSYGHIQGSSGALRQKTSLTSLVSRKENAGSSPSINSRCSPERAERLRRLQSKSSVSLQKANISAGAEAYRNENQAAYTSPPSNPWHKDYALDDSDSASTAVNSQVAGNQSVVDSFLKGRRREMRISEESGTDPAFL